MLCVALLVACAETSEGPNPGSTPSPAPTPTPTPVATGEIRLQTRDDVELVADLYPGEVGAPGFVLLHMIPPTWDRTSWPASFIDRLHGHGWWVLVLDRRGAGESGGAAVDAYQGDLGRYDLEAAAVFLQTTGAGPLAAIGASNGTTTVLDYADLAVREGLPVVSAAGFMTGGTYTETNRPFADMPGIPSIFTYSTAERQWSEAQRPLDPGSWSFLEYPDGDHGTLLFSAAPSAEADIDAFFLGQFGDG